METKGLTCKIPLELHSRITDEIQRTESTPGKFIEKIILEHFSDKTTPNKAEISRVKQRGLNRVPLAPGSTPGRRMRELPTAGLEKGRTLAFSISEELFQQIKGYLARYEEAYGRRLTQKEFVVSLIQQALEEADEEFEAARAGQKAEETAREDDGEEMEADVSENTCE